MTRSRTPADITTKASRTRLLIRRNPYYLKLAASCHLGFRRGPDTWIARFRDRSKKMHFKPLRNLPSGSGDQYTEAKKAAERWFAQMTGVPLSTVLKGSVREAVQVYITGLREVGREATAERMEKLFERVLESDPFADVQLTDMTLVDFKGWRTRLRTPKPKRGKRATYDPTIRVEALRRLKAGESMRALCREYGMDPTTLRKWKKATDKPAKMRTRQNQSINRLVRQMQAALTGAVASGMAGNPAAWTMVRLDEDARRRPSLSPEQRGAVLSHCASDLQDFLQGMEHTGARPGELARSTVADLDARSGTVRLWSRKGNGSVRERFTVLSTAGAAFFKRMARNKLPAAALFTSPTPDVNGGHWQHYQWANGIRAAIHAVNKDLTPKDEAYIPLKACAYSFRHARISELLQVNKLDAVLVSELTGTSLEIIKKHYYHVIADHTRAALDLTPARKAN